MKTNNKISLLLFLVIMITAASCGKYDDGPWFSIYSKTERVSGNWRFESVNEGGTDKTEEYAEQSVNIMKNGEVYWTQGHIPSSYTTYGPSGTWTFINSKNQIEMHFTAGVTEEYTIVWDITRMAYADLQLERYEGDSKIVWKLWKY